MLLDGIYHVAWISKDAERLKTFYANVFDAEVGPTQPHGQAPGETMTVIHIGPHTEVNLFISRAMPSRTVRHRCGAAAASTTSVCTRPPKRCPTRSVSGWSTTTP